MMTLSKITSTVSFLALLSIVLSGTALHAEDRSLSGELIPLYPVRNGDFAATRPRYLPTAWEAITQKGRPQFNIERRTGAGIHLQNFDAMATITTDADSRGSYLQHVPLMPGSYTLNVELAVAGTAQASILVADQSETVGPKPGWTTVTLDFDAGPTETITLDVQGAGKVQFRSVWMDIRQVESTCVPAEAGDAISRIALAPDCSAAEEFAAYELQRAIYAMTGQAPALVGRDSVTSGRKILLGAAGSHTDLTGLGSLAEDSYLVGVNEQNDIVLAGNTHRGTLYAAYDFLKLQGCGWFMPGRLGEVIPKRDTLVLPGPSRIETPDWEVRGFLITLHCFAFAGDWFIQGEDILDWAVRNRMNGFWYGQTITADFRAHRGGGYDQLLGHTWHLFLNPAHPEWWALVDGERVRLHKSGRPNMLCVSNQALRDHVVKAALAYFAGHPNATVYALNPDDEPANWCECAGCRALDGDSGKGEWVKDKNGHPAQSMSDRTVDFVNEVADRVSRVHPHKQIELYIYGSYREPPTRQKVHPNIILRYTFWPGAPLNRPLLDASVVYNRNKVMRLLDGWKAAGAQHFGLYDYGEFFHPDRPIFWFYSITNALKTFHDRWSFRNCMGETDNTISASFMWHNIRARALWDVDLDYEKEVEDICTRFYGRAAKPMKRYYDFMTASVMQSNAWKEFNYVPAEAGNMGNYSWLQLLEQPVDRVLWATRLLDQALAQAGDDPLLQHRLQIARYGHALLTYFVIEKAGASTDALRAQADDALSLAIQLTQRYDIKISHGLSNMLKGRVAAASAAMGRRLFTLPVEWQFKTDPQDQGVQKEWFASKPDQSWKPILTNEDWTSQGHDYHGVAWYTVMFQLGVEEAEQKEFQQDDNKLALQFDAVDGTADIFLDGRQIGAQKKPAAEMWDKPFLIDLPADFDATMRHRLTVRVEKDSAAAGIWKPVWIVVPAEAAAK